MVKYFGKNFKYYNSIDINNDILSNLFIKIFL